MTLLFPLDDVRSLRETLDKKAYDIFKGVPGKAPLQVTRVLAQNDPGRGGAQKCRLEKNENVWDIPDIEKLRNVSILSLRYFEAAWHEHDLWQFRRLFIRLHHEN